MDKSELWLMRNNFYKIGHRKKNQTKKQLVSLRFLLKLIQIKLIKNMTLL